MNGFGTLSINPQVDAPALKQAFTERVKNRPESPVWRMFREQPFTVQKRFLGKRSGADKFRERSAPGSPHTPTPNESLP